MTETALDIITKALKRLGVISGIETPSADLAADGLDRLNALIETWSTESLTVWRQVALGGTSVTIQPKQFYYIGPSNADIVAPVRPSWIDAVSWLLPGTPLTEYPLQPYSQQEWERERVKLLTSTQATRYYYLPDMPNGVLFLWPMPQSAFQLWIYAPLAIVGAVTLVTTLSYPPGYSRALRDWLAIELAPELGRPVDPALLQSATEAKAQLQRVNFRPRTLDMPPGVGCSNSGGSSAGGAYDWRSDT